jgi:uncharacterized protein YndB with AHSA1/START domain
MEKIDWSHFVVRVNIKAPVDILYQAWATRSGMEKWFLRLSEFKKPGGTLHSNDEYVQKGDTYRWRWYGWPDEMEESGEILECNGKDLLRFSFGKAGNCTIKIYPEQGETIVELIQENIPTDEQSRQNWHVGCKTGWTFFLANMKSLFEGGIDLRNKNEKLQKVLTA